MYRFNLYVYLSLVNTKKNLNGNFDFKEGETKNFDFGGGNFVIQLQIDFV